MKIVSLEFFVLNRKPLIRLNKNSLFFFESKNVASDNNKIIVLQSDIVIVDKIFLLIIKKNVCEIFSFFSRDYVSHPKIFLENLLPIKPEFRFIFGEGYVFWFSNIEGMGYLNCSQISNGKSTNIQLDKVDIIDKKDYKIFFPDGCFKYNSFKVFIQSSDSVIKILGMIINYKVELSVDDIYFNNDQVRLKYISFSGQKTFLSVLQNANVLIKDTTNSNFQIQSYSEDKIFNSLDKNLYIQHGIYIRIFPWVDNVSDKLKEIPTNTNYSISFCAYLEKSDVLFLIYRKPQKFDICIVKDFGIHKWVYDIESSSAQLLLIDNLLYFFLVNDNHKEIGVKILDLNDYIN